MYMPQTVKAKVSSVKKIAKDTITLDIQHEYLANKTAPGQFLHILIQGHTLRRPISIADVNKEDETVTIIFKVIGEGTKRLDRKSTRLNSSHVASSYAVFCLKKKKITYIPTYDNNTPN